MSDGLEQAIQKETRVTVWTQDDEDASGYEEVLVLSSTPTYIEILVPASGENELNGFRAIVPWHRITEIVLHD